MRVDEGVKPRIPDRTWARRALSVPAIFLGAALWWATAPLWLPLAALLDLLNRRTTLVRAGMAVAVLLAADVLGLLAAAGTWLVSGVWAGADDARFLGWNRRVQAAWSAALLGGLVRLFRLDVQVEGQEALAPGGFILLVRHVSMADTLLPMGLVALPHGYAVRYVLKSELRWEPCLDVYGGRLPNAFVHRGRGRAAEEAARIGALAEDLGPEDVVVLFPEGTRFTPGRLARARARTSGHPALRDLAHELGHTLPPHLPGVLALRQTAPRADLVVCAHRGLGGVRRVADLWNGALLDRRIDVRFWRIPAVQSPISADDTAALLAREWRRLDRWVAPPAAPAT
jgi:1-acyl-sn-glycerol-3-phosphate acyltransferase